ncbi:MAG TPA: glycosyltransferase family 87 protein [Actinocrinis sp.]
MTDSRRRIQRRIQWAAIGWLVTRVILVLLVTGHAGRLDGYGAKSQGDIYDYGEWANSYLVHMSMPTGTNWQYPPLVAPILLLPKLIPDMSYYSAFIVWAFLADAVIAVTLLWTAARRNGSVLGVWYWTLAIPLLGSLVYGRFDVFSAVFVVVSLALLGRGVPSRIGGGRALNNRRWIAGALIGLGAAVKIWPGLTVFGLPRTKRGVQTAIAAVVAGVGGTAIVSSLFTNGWSFVGSQSSRGIEMESVWAAPFLAARQAHLWSGHRQFRYGSYEIVGPGVTAVDAFALLSTLAVFALLAWWWWRMEWRPAVAADATLVATMLMIVTSRVISPQYMIWLIAVAAFCLLYKDTSQRRSALVLLVCMPLTQLEFPFGFHGLIYYHLGPFLALALRNLLLVVAAVIGFRDLWRSTVVGPVFARRVAAGGDPSGDEPEAAPAETAPVEAPSAAQAVDIATSG